MFQDATCGEGATVCEIKDSEALDVYGYLDTIELAWDGGYLVMTQTVPIQTMTSQPTSYQRQCIVVCTGTVDMLCKINVCGKFHLKSIEAVCAMHLVPGIKWGLDLLC